MMKGVHRVTKRLGWIRAVAGADEAHRVLEAAIPDNCKLDLHVNLISHGRAICRADGNGGPRCGECFLRDLCVFGQKQTFDDLAPRAKIAKPREDFFITIETEIKIFSANTENLCLKVRPDGYNYETYPCKVFL